ncbi:MAG: hypothetical protein L3K02_03490 [Thermoplasmata archaeon]|nr:hypothetical protein [Thermoplasmata archaeon]
MPEEVEACPKCHLSTQLFVAVREAAGPLGGADLVSIQTIGEILAAVDLSVPAVPGGVPSSLARAPRLPPLRAAPSAPPPEEPRPSFPLSDLQDLPSLPAGRSEEELDRKIDEYFQLGRRLELDFSEFESRHHAADLVNDRASLETIAREMFVHLVSGLAEEFESVVAQRNELAAFVPTPSADVEIDAIRRAISQGDLPGAQRRLAHVRDEVQRIEEEWEVGKILVTEAEMLAATVHELGGDPGPAMGPVEEGRKMIRVGRRTEGERLLARGAVALWAVLEPRLVEDLQRLKLRLAELRAAGLDIQVAVEELRVVMAELRQRNYVGTIVAYRRARAFVEQHRIPGEESGSPGEVSAPIRPFTSA